MTERYSLNTLRPNNWYLNEDKVRRVREAWSKGEQDLLPPVLVVRIDDHWALIDGHSRAWVALEHGEVDILGMTLNNVDSEEFGLYEIIHRRGPSEGVRNLQDLSERILPSSEYEEKWIKYCRSLT